MALEILITRQEINNRVAEMGQHIRSDFKAGTPIHFVAVLKGAFVFLSDLIRAFELPVTCDFMAVSSYGDAQASSGVVRLTKDLDQDLAGRHRGPDAVGDELVAVLPALVERGLVVGHAVLVRVDRQRVE